MKPPRRLGVARLAPVLVVSSGTVCKLFLQLVKSPLLQEVTLLFGERGKGKPLVASRSLCGHLNNVDLGQP